MTDKMKQSLITELLFSDKPKLYSRNKWAEIAREGESDRNSSKPILLALAKCKYTPCDILQSTILEEMKEEAKICDLLLILGTSLSTYPVSQCIEYFSNCDMVDYCKE